ncbi:phospholipase D-like domain-containing protein DpdK [Paenibacillus sp. LS1]|uniref:phospholipase D-like domain-containing protein DpdK n=1 Tax=Paenibacillus sp. LS1 TaxID=2992120 RepID=UPI00222F9C7D|nr:phospholipase D-like domain-containing protein DpdK [Paenibacillus sp. LS1]MCW3795382.1 phospholipase D-like domain-containing protein DpdK [Paenibacillus sp. LS1]
MTRYIYTNAVSREIPDLLQSLLTAELIRPSRQLFLASPWISDIPVIRNRSNEFLVLEPQWARKDINFSDVIAYLIDHGTNFYLETRKIDLNEDFVKAIQSKTSKFFDVRYNAILHRKGLLGDNYYLSGSMNFTYNGISTLDEFLQYTADSNEVAENRIVWNRGWGEGKVE